MVRKKLNVNGSTNNAPHRKGPEQASLNGYGEYVTKTKYKLLNVLNHNHIDKVRFIKALSNQRMPAVCDDFELRFKITKDNLKGFKDSYDNTYY